MSDKQSKTLREVLVCTWGKGNTYFLLVRVQTVQPLWKLLWKFFKKLKKKVVNLQYGLPMPLMGVYIYMSQRLLLLQRHILLQRHLLSLFIMSLFTTARKQTTQISTNWWISNENLAYVCNKILFSYFKKNKIVKFAVKWMESEIIILNKVIQTQEGKCHMFSLIFGCWLLIFKYVCFFGNARRI